MDPCSPAIIQGSLGMDPGRIRSKHSGATNIKVALAVLGEGEGNTNDRGYGL